MVISSIVNQLSVYQNPPKFIANVMSVLHSIVTPHNGKFAHLYTVIYCLKSTIVTRVHYEPVSELFPFNLIKTTLCLCFHSM